QACWHLIFGFIVWVRTNSITSTRLLGWSATSLFMGDWQSTAVYKASILGSAGTYRSSEHGEMLGDLILVTHAQGSWISGGPPGAPSKVEELTITRYDAAKELYTFDGFNNSGEHTTATQTCEGNSCIGTGSFELDH